MRGLAIRLLALPALLLTHAPIPPGVTSQRYDPTEIRLGDQTEHVRVSRSGMTTAGPEVAEQCPLWVKSSNAPSERNYSAFPARPDIRKFMSTRPGCSSRSRP